MDLTSPSLPPGVPYLGTTEDLERAMAVNAAIRACPHRRVTTCAGRARCALGKGKSGRVDRRDCEACVMDSGIPEKSPVPDGPSDSPPAVGVPRLVDGRNRDLRLTGVAAGRAVALCCGGPSFAQLDRDAFMAPWCDRAAVNNTGALVRPHWWFSVDAPGSFHDAIWRDPAIFKFAWQSHSQSRVRVKTPGGFRDSDRVAADCPSVGFYPMHSRFDHRSWLADEFCTWGRRDDESCALGLRGGRTVLLVALKWLVVLGYRTIVLFGCDWVMNTEGPQYAFAQSKDRRACDKNNRSYAVSGQRFAALRPILEAVGVTVLNANPESHLAAFDRVSPADGIHAIRRANEISPDLEGWY